MSALREMLIKIGIISDIEGAKDAEAALNNTAEAAGKVNEEIGGAAGGADKLADAVGDMATAGKEAADPLGQVADAAGELGREAGPAAAPTGELATELGKAAGSAGILAGAFMAAKASIEMVIGLIREHIAALKAEKDAIDAQQALNHAGAIEGTIAALGRLCEEYDKLDAKRQRDYEAVTRQIAIDREYELAVNEREMRKAIAADPQNEKAIKEDYKQRAVVIGLQSDREKLDAEITHAIEAEKQAIAFAADAAEKEASANAAYDAAQQKQAKLAAERDAKLAAAGSRTPLLSWRRGLLGTGFTDLIYDAPRNREKRQEPIAAEYEKKIEDEGENTKDANKAAMQAKKVREQAEIDAAVAKRNREMAMQRANTLRVKEETAALESRPVSASASAPRAAAGSSPAAAAPGGGFPGPTNERLAAEMKRAADNIDATTGSFAEAVRAILSATERLAKEAADAAARTKQPGG